MNRQELAPVMFFDGEEHLAAAGALLLESPGVEAVVVHNVAQEALFALGRQQNLRGEAVKEALFTDAPHLAELDAYVQARHTSSDLSTRYNLTTLSNTQRTVTRSGSIGTHIDSPFGSDVYAPAGSFEGPLTLSVRIDAQAERRIFRAERTHVHVLTATGIDKQAVGELHGHVSRLAHARRRTAMYDIEQQSGDMVIIANYPTPTIHAVESDGDDTRALIASYLLQDNIA